MGVLSIISTFVPRLTFIHITQWRKRSFLLTVAKDRLILYLSVNSSPSHRQRTFAYEAQYCQEWATYIQRAQNPHIE